MSDSRPRIESRRERLRAYLRHNRVQMAVDVAVLAAWVLLTAAVARRFGLPTWLFYVAVFVGVVAYAQMTPAWRRPYRSPD